MASDSVSVGKEVFGKQGDVVLDSVSTAQEEVDLCTFDKVCNLGEGLDWISQLPDEVLIDIVSRLTFAEAFRTSVLSSRWIHLWKSAVSVLDFDASGELKALRKLRPGKAARIVPEKRRRYMNWVNGVVSQMQQSSCSRLSKFRVSFDLTDECNSEGDIDRWLKFALSKRVESLHLDLDTHITRALVFSEDCYNHLKTPAGMRDIGFLRSLRLRYVQVGGEILEHFVANCPVLEELAVEWSYLLKKLKVVGSLHSSPLALKHLEVRACNRLESVEIDHAPHLERLIFGGGCIVKELRVGNCPSLVDMTLYENCVSRQTFKALSGCASQLVSLYLKCGGFWDPISNAGEHSNLERLTFEVSGGDCYSIIGLVPLINVCPRLHTLQLLIKSYHSDIGSIGGPARVFKVGRNSIKVVEVVGFRGCEMDSEFMEYVMEHFVGLERLVIDCSSTSFVSENNVTVLLPSSSEDQLREAERCALELKSRAPATIEFLVI